jgi:hypothetical protein
MDDRKNHQLNKGSGFRMTDLDAIMRKPVVIENDKIVAKRNRLNYEVVSKERKDKINFAPTVNVESSPLLEVSRIRASELSKVSFVWDNSDHTLIIPGMPIKYVYMHRGKYTEVKGTVVMAKHRIQLQGNPGVDSVYKSSSSITALIESTNDTPDNPKENFIKAQIVWAVKNEMAINIEDFLSRRTRLLLLDQKEAVRIAPIVAEVMAKELGKDEVWQKNQIESFKNIAEIYHTHI